MSGRFASIDTLRAAKRWLAIAAWLTIVALCILRLSYLKADFPDFSPWLEDQAKFTDEGWWASGAVMHQLLGHWNVIGDYNPSAALPVWPTLLGIVFHFTGVSLSAARALNVSISIFTLGVVFLLVRRYTGMKAKGPAMLSVLLLAANPFAFAFSRLAILDTLVVFEFCILLLVASYASRKGIWPLAVLSGLVTAMILTKTTAALLVPAVLWLAWKAMGQRAAGLLRVVLVVAVLPAGLVEAYALVVAKLGYGDEYRYFFDVNAMPDIAWEHSFTTILVLLHNCFWIDLILYPIGLLVLVLSLVWWRSLWSNPLFVAGWISLAAQASFIFSRQEDYAPRYFLAMLAPLVLVIVLAVHEASIHSKTATAVLLLAILISTAVNLATIIQFTAHRQYRFRDAAASIRSIVESDSEQKPLIFGVSASQISLMTGIRSINDAYGTQDMAEKVRVYQPGWYLAWEGIAAENQGLLSPYRLEEAASYSVFDNYDRSTLILYKMVRR